VLGFSILVPKCSVSKVGSRNRRILAKSLGISSFSRQHIQPVITSMAVVVQKMVAAESAGVLFTRHPINGDPSVTVITANYGLGESVVSAKADPDTFLVKKSYSEDLEILGTKMGEKKVSIEMDGGTSVKDIEISDEKRNKLCLSDETVLKLAKLGLIMEKFFGTPRDIEFAVTKNEKIYLLQSRPITSLNSFTDFEIIHENDSAVMSHSHDMYTKANVGEVITGTMSVLNQSTMRKCLEESVFKSQHKGSREYSGLYSTAFPIRDQQLFMNVGAVSWCIDFRSPQHLTQHIFSYSPQISGKK
jgi:hypothetical protein